jgi:hypothetical protein
MHVKFSVFQKVLCVIAICVILAGCALLAIRASSSMSDYKFLEFYEEDSFNQFIAAIKDGTDVNIKDNAGRTCAFY